uniref:CCHC-type domain-containing protein n=1 Tax=Tanacetum cinerariifolium TaxID=118510 RepID=A0A6L2M6L4_TANCI|nr:hypothetical protein [Tanacetum cinerariifolium]GEV34490.1 hypothetical protein [Tanacetum cinerariifolium]
MTTLAEYMIVVGAKNRPPMLDKSMYNTWESRMLFKMTVIFKQQTLFFKQVQVNTKFLNALQPEWRKFVTDSFAGIRTKGNATSSGGNNVAGQAGVIKCVICQGEGHMARQCTKPKRPWNSAWFKEKMLQAQEFGQTDDLKAYDSDCDDISSIQAVLMANLSSYGSNVLSEVPQQDTYQNENTLNQSVLETQYFEQSLIDYVSDNEITNDINIISYEKYLQQTQNLIVQDTNSSAQQNAMIMYMFEQMSN